MNTWQPIETAPKDGTWVLLAGATPEDRPWLGEEEDDNNILPPFVVGRFNRMGFGHGPERAPAEWWLIGTYDSGQYLDYLAPTHWMPLPEPPQPETDA